MQQYPQLAEAITKFRNAVPIKPDLVVRQSIASDHYIGSSPGDRIDVMDILSDGVSIVCRSKAGVVGFFNLDFVASDEEIVQGFEQEEEAAARRQEEEQRAAARQAELDYEENLRNNMFNKIANDKVQRKADAERRKAEQAARLQQLEEQRLHDAEIAAYKAAELQARNDSAARAQAERAARLRAEAQHEKAQWDKEEHEYREEKALSGLPEWKKELILAKRNK